MRDLEEPALPSQRKLLMNALVNEFLKRFKSLGLDGEPCGESEIESLEQHHGVTFPAAYKAYLLIAGNEPPWFWVGSDCTIRWLFGLHDAADELLAECRQPPLPPCAFVFVMHQGYQFMYFLADGSSDDPPVHYFLEGKPSTLQTFERFSDLISTCIKDH